MKKNFSILLLTCLLFFGGNAIAQNKYKLITSTSNLVSGEKYIIASAQSGSAQLLGYQNTNNRPQPTGGAYTISSGVITVTPATSTGETAKAYEITLGGSTGFWTLYDATYPGYLYAASTSSNYLRTQTTSTTWTITFSSNAAIMTSANVASRNILQYNSSSSLFSCYTSGQTSPFLYRRAYSVTYLGNSNTGGTAPTDAIGPYFTGASVTVLANTGSLVRTGYTFSGWNTKADGTGTDYAATGSATYTKTAINDTLYAKWTPAGNTVTFDANGGSGTMANQTASVPTNLTANAFTRTGYTFAGWATTAGGTVAYTNGASYPFSANATLYAVWTPNNNTITFDGNGATGGSTTTQTLATAATANLNTNGFTRTGFTFAGWATTAGGIVAFGDGAPYTMGTSNVTLYAKWTAIGSYTVIFDANGGSGTMANQTASSPTALTTNAFTRAGFIFTGWNTIAGGGGTAYANGATYGFTANVTLYAQWTATYTLTYNGNSNTSGTAPTDGTSPYIAGATVTVLANTGTLVRTGYTFAGWNTNSSGSGTDYAATGSVTFTMPAANTILYAKWTPNNNTITFDGNSATGGSTTTQTLATAATASLNTNGFTRTGYTFAGWATTAGGVVAYADGASYTMGTSNVTLYAKWTPNNNTITFDGNGATGGSMSNQTIATAATATLTANAYTRTGYTFAGWATTAGGTVAYTDGASYTMGTASVTLYAVWNVYVAPCESDDFESGSFPGTWTTTGGINGSSGDYYVNLNVVNEYILLPVGANTYSSVSFNLKGSASSNAWTLNVQYSSDGSSWNNTTNIAGTSIGTTYSLQTVTIPTPSQYVRLNLIARTSNSCYIGNLDAFCVTCTAPITQASSVTTNTPTTGGFSIGWTDGDGDGTMIVVRPTSASNTLPAISTSYTPNLAWASAGQIDVNNRVVHRNTGSTAGPVTGLTPETQYTITAYEYNTTDNCYKLTTPPSTTRYTLSTEPTAQPTSGLSSTTCNATSVDITVPAISAGADGYLIIRKAGSAPTGLPTDATAYTAGSTFGDATVAAIVTAAGTYTISGLTASTTYYFQLVPYNANSGAVAQTFNYLTSGTLLQTNVTTTSTSTSTASTVETDATYGYTPNILYASYQSTSVPALASNSVGVHNFIIKDGGATTDADALPTILTAISYSYTGTANTIRAAALFTTSGSKVADATTVGANSITFTGLSGSDVTTNDNNTGGAKELILRVTFNSTVTDNQKLVFTVTSVTGGAVCSYSQFAAADGGGAISDNTSDDDNRIEVVATKIVFGTQPASTSSNTNLATFTIRFEDGFNNLDFDNNRTATLTATDGGVNMSASASYSITAIHSGIISFSNVQFTSAPQDDITITATTTGLTTNTVKSNPFDIFDIPLGSYKTTTNGVWSSSAGNNTITWEELTGSGWNTMTTPSYPPTNTTNRVYIHNNVTLNGTNTAKNIIVEGTGNFSTNTVTPTFKNLLVKSGGVFNKQSNGIKFDADGILEVLDGGTMTFTRTNSSNHAANLWAGTEKFHPNSTFIVLVTDNAAGNGTLITEVIDSISQYNGALFGNFIIDMQGNGRHPLFPPDINENKLTNGDFIFRNGIDTRPIATGDYSITIGGNLIVESTYDQDISLTTSSNNVNVTINKNFIHNGTKEFRLANSNPSGTALASNVTVNVDSNIVIGSSVFKYDIGVSASATQKVNLKGDITVATGGLFANMNTASKGQLNFTGIGDGSTDDLTQKVTISSTGATRNQYINFNVGNGAYVQLGDDLELGNSAKVTDSTGGTFDFGFNGSTPLIVTTYSSGAGFESRQGSTLKITSPDGLYDEWDRAAYTAAGVTVNTGNVQAIAKSNRSFSPIATFWYIGKADQKTGDAPNVTLSTSADAKVVICDLANKNLVLTPTVSFGVTDATTISPTGGKLDIRNGQFIETETEYIFGSTGTLYMSQGTLYKIVKGSATDPFGGGDDIPRMDGSGFPYVLTGGTIELGGTGTNHQYQRLRSDNAFYNYVYVKYSGNNTSGTFKNLNQTTNIDSALIITGTPIVDCFTGGTGSAASFVGNGGLIMDGGLLRIRKRTDTNPELEGINEPYTLTGGTIEFYGTNALGNRQQIRGNYGSPTKVVEYNNLEINADEARLTSTGPGNVDLTSSFTLKGTMNVNAPAILNMDSDDFIYKFTGNTSNNVNINSGAGLTYGSPFGITTVAGGGTGLEPTVGAANPSAGNIRTNIRTFDANASYGFVSPGNMVSGSGLPATVKSLYVLKSNLTDRVTLTNSVRADSALRMYSGHIITGSNRVELGKDVSNRGTLDYTAGYVVGNMRRWYDGTNSGNASGLYPLGEDKSGTLKNRKYLIEYSSDPTGGYLDVNFNPVNMGLAGLPITGIPAVGSCTSSFDVTSTEDEGYWIATPEASRLGDGAYKLSITGEDFSTVTDLCELTLLKRVGAGNWTTPGTHLQPTGSISVPTVSRSGITGFSNFGFGGGAPNPLPVELTSFTGTCVEDGISQITWSTASEFNSKHFIVQRSTDGVQYTAIAVIPAAGFSTQPRNYSITDTSVNANSSYYRLIEVDFNNQQTIYSFIQVKCNEVNGIHVFYTQPKVTVEVVSTKDKQVGFNVYEVSGKLLHAETKQIVRGYNRFDLSMQDKLAKGIYIIQMIDGEKATSTKVMVH